MFFQDHVYFTGGKYDSLFNFRSYLYKSDGSELGTSAISEKKINQLFSTAEKLFYVEYKATNTFQIGYTTNTDGNFVMVDKNFKSVSFFYFHNGFLYFLADDNQSGLEIWKTDGTVENTTLVKDINTGPGSSVSKNIFSFAVADGKLFFVADDGQHGFELWETDGTDIGTKMIYDINTVRGSIPKELTTVGENLFFTAEDEHYDRELWKINFTITNVPLNKTNENNHPFTIFPNPSSGNIHLTMHDYSAIKHIALYTTMGNKLAEFKPSESSEQIDLTKFGKGVYIIKFFGFDESIQSEKIVIY